MSATIFCIMMKCGPNISDITLSILNFAMELIIAVMLVFTFKPTLSSIKILAIDAIKKVNIKEVMSIIIFKTMLVAGGEKVVIDILYLIDENIVNSLIYDLIIKINGPIQYILNAVILCILCPTIEELIFRNIIFKRISKRFSACIGIIISSIVFAAINVGNGVVGAFIFGIANCIIYLKYKNIVMPILINLSFNIVECIILIPVIGRKINNIIFSSANIPVSLSVSFLMMVAGLILFHKFFANNKKYIADYNNELKNNLQAYGATKAH